MPLRANSLETAGNSGTGFRKALSTSITSPSTESNFTISPEGFTCSAVVASGAKGLFPVEHPATAKLANKPAEINSLLDVSFVFMGSF